jgi:hypothetical protein
MLKLGSLIPTGRPAVPVSIELFSVYILSEVLDSQYISISDVTGSVSNTFKFFEN